MRGPRGRSPARPCRARWRAYLPYTDSTLHAGGFRMLSDACEYQVAQSPRATHSVHMELVYGARTLDVDIADVEEGEEDASDLRSDVLDAGDEHARDLAVEEAVLSNLDDAHIREHPDVQVVARVEAPCGGPHKEKPYPEPSAPG